MTYVGYARRFRPKTFGEIVGQESVVLTLRHALDEGRASHAYLFAGPRGVGKTTTARILAKALNCERGPGSDPCGECARCLEIAGGGSLDVMEIDAASHNSVDSIRELRDSAHNATHGSRFRLYILDEVHMLSTPAFNALLKILEEPPSHVKFVLCTTDPQKVPETVRSRCQRLDFRRIAIPQVIERLGQIAGREKLEISGDALRAVAVHVRGGMRDAEVLLEQLSVYADGPITAEHVRALTGSVDEAKLASLSGAFAAGDAAAALAEADAVLEAGTDTTELVDALLSHLRGALTVQACGESDSVAAARGIDVASARKTAEILTQEQLLYCAAALQSARKEAQRSEQPRILLELTLVRLSRVKELVTLEELAARMVQMSEARAPSAETGAARRGGRGGAPSAVSTPARGAPRGPSSGAARPRHAGSDETRERSPFAGEEKHAPREPSAAGEGGREPVPESIKGDLTPANVRERWELILSRVARESGPVGAFLRPAELTDVADDVLTLAFPPRFTYHMSGLLADKSRLALVESAASEIIGRPLKVSLVSSGVHEDDAGDETRDEARRGDAGSNPLSTPRTPEAGAVGDRGVQKLVERFDGQIVRVGRRSSVGPPGGAEGGPGDGTDAG